MQINCSNPITEISSLLANGNYSATIAGVNTEREYSNNDGEARSLVVIPISITNENAVDTDNEPITATELTLIRNISFFRADRVQQGTKFSFAAKVETKDHNGAELKYPRNSFSNFKIENQA